MNCEKFPDITLLLGLNQMHLYVDGSLSSFLAHLWGAYAIPLELSVVHHPSSVSTITTRNNEAIKSIFSANVYHVAGLCLLGIGGAPYIIHKIMAPKQYFHIFDFFSETTSRCHFILYQKIA